MPPPQRIKKVPVGAIIDRPQILHCKICSPLGEKTAYFPLGNPKIKVFRRAINDRPYNLHRNDDSLAQFAAGDLKKS